MIGRKTTPCVDFRCGSTQSSIHQKLSAIGLKIRIRPAMRTRGGSTLQADIVPPDAEEEPEEEPEEDEEEEDEEAEKGDDEGGEGESPRRKKKKRKRSHRCKTWDEESTKKLIVEYGERFEKTEELPDRDSKENRKAWKGITKKLRKIGYSFSVKSAQARWDSLEADYMEMATRNVHPGLKRMTCPFGRELTEILNPSGMKNYLQIEEEERKEKEAKSEQANEPESGGLVPEIVVVDEVESKDLDEDSDTGSVLMIGSSNSSDGSVCSPRDNMERAAVICHTVDLTTSDNGPSAKAPRVEFPTNLRRNVVIHKSDNYVEIVQSEPITPAPGPSKPHNEDMLLGIACQLHRHLVHHQPTRLDPKPPGHQAQAEDRPSEGTSKPQPKAADDAASVDRAKTIGFLETVIEKLMLEKEKKLALLEERNAIDRERMALERSKMRLMEQLIALVHTNRRT